MNDIKAQTMHQLTIQQATEIERLRAALREHACECVSVCMDAKHNYGEIDTPDTCKYGRAALALAQKTTDVC